MEKDLASSWTPIELNVVAGDSIVVWDWDLRKLLVFGADGSHERSVLLQPPMRNPTGKVGLYGREGLVFGSHDYRQSGRRLTPQFLQVLRYDWNGILLDTLATLPYGEIGPVESDGPLVASPLFESKSVFSTHGGLLYTSEGSLPEVRAHRGDRLESIIRWEPGDRSVRKEDVEAHQAAWLESAGASALSVRKSLNAFPAKEVFPAVTEIQIDAQGRIWIRTFPRPGSTAIRMAGLCEDGRVHMQPVRTEGPQASNTSTIRHWSRCTGTRWMLSPSRVRSFRLPEG